MQCNKCGKPSHTPGVTMNRINPKGEKGIFECSPACNVTHISNEAALMHALDSNETIGEEHVQK